jgi:predicted Zn-dependent protease with MMP-like domain
VARNLADPDYEPSDEELQQLAHAAFAEVPARQREAERRLWEEIEALRVQLMARLAKLRAGAP